MKEKLRIAAIAAPAALASLGGYAQLTKSPNIILFLVDDMGWQDTSVPFYGDEQSMLNQRFHTPNMERLAAIGVKFTNAYACPISSPTRCSLMSGMNTARHRVTNWTLNLNSKTDAGSSVITLPDWNYNGIQPENTNINNSTPITSLPQILKNNGYYTIHCGKAHFGASTTPGADPSTMGFDVNIAGGANGAPRSYLSEDEFGKGDFHVKGLEKYYGTGKFLTECLTEEAILQMDTAIAKNKPFYLYMSHYAVHAPYSKDNRFFGNYKGKSDAALNHVNSTTEAKINDSEACYDALVEGMDKSLGDILDYVNKKGIAGNTIIMFMSDNGGQPLSPRQGEKFTQNLPARGGKGSAFEGGTHEPMMVYMPGITKGGTINANRVMIEDFFPTIIEMAGVEKYKTVQKVDGKSFLDIIKNTKKQRERTIYWHFPNLWGESQNIAAGYGATSTILKGNYRLIYSWQTQQLRLFNIVEDIHENIDLAARMPRKTAELAKDLSNYLRSVDAQRPSLKATGKLIGWPDEAGKAHEEPLPFTLTTAKVKNNGEAWSKGIVWHTMTIGNHYCRYNASTNSIEADNSIEPTNPTDENLWAICGNDEKGYIIYNKAAGSRKTLWASHRTNDSTAPVKMTDIESTDGIFWSISKTNKGWNIVRKNSVDNFLNRRNGCIGMWTTPKAEGNAESIVTFKAL